MKLTAPRELTFLVALIVAGIAFLIAAKVITNPLDTVAVVWIALAGYAILCLGTVLKGI